MDASATAPEHTKSCLPSSKVEVWLLLTTAQSIHNLVRRVVRSLVHYCAAFHRDKQRSRLRDSFLDSKDFVHWYGNNNHPIREGIQDHSKSAI